MFKLALALLSAGLCANSAHAQQCLPYAPKSVTLSGKLERKTFPGAPNFESVARGDAPETGFYVVLKKPVCMSGVSDSAEFQPHDHVRLVQLILDQQGYDLLRPQLGHRVVLSGSLLSAFTGHHHAPLLMQEPRLASGT